MFECLLIEEFVNMTTDLSSFLPKSNMKVLPVIYTPLVSILIPVYNVKKYIERSVRLFLPEILSAPRHSLSWGPVS